jgi:hypothetical protein
MRGANFSPLPNGRGIGGEGPPLPHRARWSHRALFVAAFPLPLSRPGEGDEAAP